MLGPTLPGFSNPDANTDTADFSPDGHWLAYQAGDLSVLDLTGHHAPEGIPDCCDTGNMIWSPDGTQLAFGDNVGGLALFSLSTGKSAPLLGAQALGIRELVGWIDNAHLAVTLLTLSADHLTTQGVTVGSYDIATRQLRDIATVRSAAFGTPYVSLSPDGTKALVFNQPYRDRPYVPLVDEIDVASGAIMPLPHLAQVMGLSLGFTSVAWRPGSRVIAASAGFDVNGDLRTWVLDLGADAVLAEVTPAGYAAGWAPDGSAFVFSSGWQAGIPSGPFSLAAVVVGSNGHVSATPLTSDAMSFPFLGFARTA